MGDVWKGAKKETGKLGSLGEENSQGFVFEPVTKSAKWAEGNISPQRGS